MRVFDDRQVLANSGDYFSLVCTRTFSIFKSPRVCVKTSVRDVIACNVSDFETISELVIYQVTRYKTEVAIGLSNG